jgi:hypothetical protein
MQSRRGASGRLDFIPGRAGMAKSQKKVKAQKLKRRRKVEPSRKKAATAPVRRRARKPATPAPAPRGKLERVRMPPQTRKPASRDTKAAADDANEGKYVYCVIKSERPLSFGLLGIGPEPAEVHTVHYRGIAAIVSNTPMVVQDPTKDNVLAHQRVNETVMQHHTVIPMSFGTLFKTDDDIMEFGLKVLWDRDQIIHEIEEEDEDIRRLKGEISSQKGSTYFARMQYGRLIDAALQARSERYVAEIFEGLRDVSVASRSNKPIGDRMIMNAAFLVARNLEHAFDVRVKDIGQSYEKLTFKYTGPWPPYNFVNIRLKLERAH